MAARLVGHPDNLEASNQPPAAAGYLSPRSLTFADSGGPNQSSNSSSSQKEDHGSVDNNDQAM